LYKKIVLNTRNFPVDTVWNMSRNNPVLLSLAGNGSAEVALRMRIFSIRVFARGPEIITEPKCRSGFRPEFAF